MSDDHTITFASLQNILIANAQIYNPRIRDKNFGTLNIYTSRASSVYTQRRASSVGMHRMHVAIFGNATAERGPTGPLPSPKEHLLRTSRNCAPAARRYRPTRPDTGLDAVSLRRILESKCFSVLLPSYLASLSSLKYPDNAPGYLSFLSLNLTDSGEVFT